MILYTTGFVHGILILKKNNRKFFSGKRSLFHVFSQF